MDFSWTTSAEIGQTLSDFDYQWGYDADGDVKTVFSSPEPPFAGLLAFHQSESEAFHGWFPPAEPMWGGAAYKLPVDRGHWETDMARRQVTVYFMPRRGYTLVQIHASVIPSKFPEGGRIRVTTEAAQVDRIKRMFPGAVAKHEGGALGSFWFSVGIQGDVAIGLVLEAAGGIGMAMFDGTFTGCFEFRIDAQSLFRD